MRTIAVISTCALLGLAAPALAQNSAGVTTQGGAEQNGSPNGAASGAAKQPGKSDAGAGKHDMSKEGRSSATDANGAGASGK